MFAFSETVWEPKVAIYEENISTLKPKERQRIMDAAAEYLGKAPPLSKGKGHMPMTEEKLELIWESGSDGDD